LLPHFIADGEEDLKDPIPFIVPGVHLKAIEGGTLSLHYLLERDVNGTIVKRESARAPILNIGEPRNELPAPEVSGVVGGVMDPTEPQATLTVDNYQGKAIGDEVHCVWEGSVTGVFNRVVTVNSLSLPVAITFSIPATEIAPNVGGEVDASYWVLRKATGNQSYSDVLTFSVGQPVGLTPPVLSSIKDVAGAEIPDNGSTSDTSVTVAGTAPAGRKVEIFDDAVSKGELTANANGDWTTTLTGLATGPHAIKAKALYGSGEDSAVRRFSVSTVAAIAITDVKDPTGASIVDGGETRYTTVTVHGTVTVA